MPTAVAEHSGGAVVAHGANPGVSPGLQRTGARRAAQLPSGEVGLGLTGVRDADHRIRLRARRTSVVYQGPRRPGASWCGPRPAAVRRADPVAQVGSARHDDDPRREAGIPEPGTALLIVTVAAPTNAMATGHPSSWSTAGIDRQANIRGGAQHPGRAAVVPGRRSRSWPVARRRCCRGRARRAGAPRTAGCGAPSRGAAAVGSHTRGLPCGRGARSVPAGCVGAPGRRRRTPAESRGTRRARGSPWAARCAARRRSRGTGW